MENPYLQPKAAKPFTKLGNEEKHVFMAGGKDIQEGEWISIDGTSGEVLGGQIATQPSEIIQVIEGEREPQQSVLYQDFTKLLYWADQIKRLNVRANTDTPEDARMALAFGAQGVGLCRTEHMFFERERLPQGGQRCPVRL